MRSLHPAIIPFVLLAGLMAVDSSDGKTLPTNRRVEPQSIVRGRDLTADEYTALQRRLMGRSESAVIQALGKPDSIDQRGEGTTRWWYGLAEKAVVQVFVKNGRVIDMSHNEWQTGGREFVEEDTP